MSLHDAVIIITLTNDMTKEYRVNYVQDIQNLSSFLVLRECFKDSKAYFSVNKVIKAANIISFKYASRYGIIRMNKYKYYEWEDILEGAHREEMNFSNNQPF